MLTHVVISENTIEFVLERCRDADPSIRKLAYGGRLADVDPRSISIQHREYILRNGLHDRLFVETDILDALYMATCFYCL